MTGPFVRRAGGMVEIKMLVTEDVAAHLYAQREMLERMLAEQQRVVISLVERLGGSVEIPIPELQAHDLSRINVMRKTDNTTIRIELDNVVDKFAEKEAADAALAAETPAEEVPRETSEVEPGASR